MCKILIVEDNASFRQSVAELLRARFPQADVAEAADAESAFEKIAALRPELIFLDIKLPGQSGLELIKRIKGIYGPVIVILTSHDLPEYRQAAFQLGADHFFQKDATSGEDIASLVEAVCFVPPSPSD